MSYLGFCRAVMLNSLPLEEPVSRCRIKTDRPRTGLPCSSVYRPRPTKTFGSLLRMVQIRLVRRDFIFISFLILHRFFVSQRSFPEYERLKLLLIRGKSER